MILLDQKRIYRTLNRMAFQILEAAHSSTIRLIGLNNRGLIIAETLKNILEKETQKTISITNISSDSDKTVSIEKEGSDEILVVVDDVIFSGESVFNVIQRVDNLSDFKNIIVAVLVDRGHRKFPLLAEVVGFHIPTKLNEQVNLHVKDGKPEKVILTNH